MTVIAYKSGIMAADAGAFSADPYAATDLPGWWRDADGTRYGPLRPERPEDVQQRARKALGQ